MKRNMGFADRAIRITIALVIGILFFTEIVTGTLGILLLIFAGVLLLTSIISICPLYLLFGIKTCTKRQTN